MRASAGLQQALSEEAKLAQLQAEVQGLQDTVEGAHRALQVCGGGGGRRALPP